MRVSSAWSSDPQFTPMRTGFWFSTATSIMVRKLLSSLRPMPTFPGIDAVFRQGAGALGILLEQDVAVVVEVADDRNPHALFIELLNDRRDGGGGFFVIDGDPYQL